MAYAFSVSDDELAMLVVEMNAFDPNALEFPHGMRVGHYQLLAKLTRACAKKDPSRFEQMIQAGVAEPVAAVKARKMLAEAVIK